MDSWKTPEYECLVGLIDGLSICCTGKTYGLDCIDFSGLRLYTMRGQWKCCTSLSSIYYARIIISYLTKARLSVKSSVFVSVVRMGLV